MSSPGSTSAEISFEDAMTHVWQSSWQDFQRATADQVHQISIHADGQSSERVGEPLRVIIEQVCQRIEVSLNRVAERLEASFDDKFFASLRAASYDPQRQEVPSPQATSMPFMVPYEANAARPGSTAMSTAPGSCKQLKNDIGGQHVSKQIQPQSATQQLSTLDDGRQVSASVGQTSLTTTHQKSVSGQDTHQDAGERTAAASTHVSSEVSLKRQVSPPLSSMSNHAYIEQIMSRATSQIHELQGGDKAHSWFEKAYQRKVNEKSSVHEMLLAIGLNRLLLKESPKNMLVDIVRSLWFRGAAMCVVLISVIFTAFESDQQARMHLRGSPHSDPRWWFFVHLGFDTYFAVEMLLRLAAYRAWFFVDPDRWGWNLVDFFVVGVGFFSAATDGSKIYFIRVLRIMRVVRTARVLRIARAFPELRKLLLAIGASISALIWAVVFLMLTMFLFSILILQAISSSLIEDLEDHIKDTARAKFNGMFACFKTLFIVICGSDWLAPHESLSEFGVVYSVTMPIFVIFVNVGVMNVVVGVFAEAASRCNDREIIAQDQIAATEDFIGTMLELWHNLAEDDEESSWERFKEYFRDESIQAYLASEQIDASHPHLLFELIDNKRPDGKVDIHEFVLGLLRCRGLARHLHSKVILHVLSAVASDLECVRHQVEQISN